MYEDLNKNRMDPREEKIGPMFILLYLLVGAFFYFSYYVLMTDFFKVNPFAFPYLILSIYFVFATILFPYSGNKVSLWLLDHPNIDLFVIPVMSMPLAYIIGPLVFAFGYSKNSKK